AATLSLLVTPSTRAVWTHVVCSGSLPVLLPLLCLLTPPLAGATAAPDTARPLSGSRHDRSTRLPSRAYRAATASRSPCRWWVLAGGGAGVRSRGASRNCSRHGTERAAAAGGGVPVACC